MGCKSVGCTVKLDDRNDRKTYFVEIALLLESRETERNRIVYYIYRIVFGE